MSTALLSLIGFAAAVFAGPLQPRILAADDVVFLNHDGTSQIMKAAEYEALEAAAAAAGPGPASFPSLNITSTPGIVRRHCGQSNEVQVMSDESFVDSDVAMSPIVSSAGGGAIVSVENGFQLSEHLKFHGEITLGGPKVVRVSLNKKFDKTWTTTQTNTFRYSLPPNMYGVIVSQPYVRRVQGVLLSGCTDNPTRTPFEAKTYESQSYGSLTWVKGVIRMCSSETYPVPYCIGDGHHA
ncbi:uncharacterized protein LY79DRAFT_571842 [Colletotrichum navitas]|uniref:Celp0028 effector like protein n=1 Tax=Colletotrichum navitas TaxID=681940 RepID=A0AAD8PLH5_9PEZI|nr:uncharacterized protein LY79DRAFT_571842 [Colletotrichum navitas]KAK1569442.1 hypothetical protein LY79DRAFT_571842 [Colletotrichum navitas]